MKSVKLKLITTFTVIVVGFSFVFFLKNNSVDVSDNKVCELKSDFNIGNLSFNKFNIKSTSVEGELSIELDDSISNGVVKLYDVGENIASSSPFDPILTTMSERTMKYIEDRSDLKGRFQSVKVYGAMIYDGLQFREIIFVNANQNGETFKYLYSLENNNFSKCS